MHQHNFYFTFSNKNILKFTPSQTLHDPNISNKFNYELGSTDAAPKESHPRPMRRDARGMLLPVHQAASCHVGFFFSRLASTRLRLRPIRAESGRVVTWLTSFKLQLSLTHSQLRYWYKAFNLSLIYDLWILVFNLSFI